MFTEQIGQLDKLVGVVPDEVLQVLKSLLGNCAQELVHRGPITYEGPVTFTNVTNITNLTVPGTVFFGKATANWVNGGAVGSNVACDKCDSSGTLTGGSVTIYLPATGAQQPNVRTGDIVAYTVDEDGDAIAVSDYLDDRIGTIKAWSDPDNIPGGWEVLASGATIFGYAAGDPDFGTIGGTGGAKTHTHDAHNASDIADHAASNTGDSGGGTLTFTGYTGYTTSSGTVSTASSNIQKKSGSPTTIDTGNQSANPTIAGATGYAESETVAVSDPGHSHVITPTQPYQQGSPSNTLRDSPTDSSVTNLSFLGLHTLRWDADPTNYSTSGFTVAIKRSEVFAGVTITGNHTHTVNLNDLAGYLEVADHTHTLTIDQHRHPITGSGTTSTHSHTTPALSHSGSLTHNSPKHLPPYYVAVWIRRFE